MKIHHLQAYKGSSLYSVYPVCRVIIMPDAEDNNLHAALPPEFVRHCLTAIPGLRALHEQSLHNRLSTLHVGHLLLDLIEHTASKLGWQLRNREVIQSRSSEQMTIVFTYEELGIISQVVENALQLLSLLRDRDMHEIEPLQARLNRELQTCRKKTAPYSLHPDTRYRFMAALARGIPAHHLGNQVIIYGHGKNQQRMRLATSAHTSWDAIQTASNRVQAVNEMARVGLPVPSHIALTSDSDLTEAEKQLGFPFMIKSISTNSGKIKAVRVANPNALATAYQYVKEHSPLVIAERFVSGDKHRILVINGKVIAVARYPAVTDKHAHLSEAETVIDMTHRLHPDNASIACMAAQVIGLDIAGINYVTTDITRSWREVGGAITGIKPNPDTGIHMALRNGTQPDLASPVFNMLFPPGKSARIPVAVITGTNGKTTTTRITAHILARSGECVGTTSTDGVYVDNECIKKGDSSGGTSAQGLLLDPRLDSAVLEIARGSILRFGTGIDRCDVTTVTNISDEHLGELGVETREDMAMVKGHLVTLARKMVILDGDDPLTAGLAKRSRAERLCYISADEHNQLVNQHIDSGQPAVRIEQIDEEPWIVLHDHKKPTPLIPVNSLQLTFNGRALHNVQNAMCAAATAYALGKEPAFIATALSVFKNDYRHNPGRLNLFDGMPFDIFVDFCHNRHGMEAVGRFVDQYNKQRSILVFSLSSSDRRDKDIQLTMQEAANHFDEYHLCPPSEKWLKNESKQASVHALVEALVNAGVSDALIYQYDSHFEAIEGAFNSAKEDALVFVKSDDHEITADYINKRIASQPHRSLSE